MNSYLDLMEKNLTEEDKHLLKSIYAPQVVTVPPSDACMSMIRLENGEIRIYGAINKQRPTDTGTPVYISSTDCGLSWKTHLMPKGALGCAGYNRKSGRYIGVFPNEFHNDRKEIFNEEGTWAIINDEGCNSTNNRFVKMSDRTVHMLKVPMYLESCGRWLMYGQHRFPDLSDQIIVVFYSDDDGETWTEVPLYKSAPEFEIKPPHKSIRWQEHSCEPTIVELSSGELVMIVRTSQDYYYMYKSDDKGESWSGPEPTDFHGTLTQPVLQKLSDGRIVFFWCNTQPMPEIDHSTVFPPLTDHEQAGIWEDVFTNRDANHLAISEDDMKTWTGFRELYLNPLRYNADFRSVGGVNSQDKSVHQAQMLELPYNKLLIHFGQNQALRKVAILDIDWLYEKERSEDFRLGLDNVSTQMYIKSNLGGFRGFSGHCAYNRTNGALLIPDPSGNFREVLQICRVEDERIVYKKQGVVWNFPASHKGRVETCLSVVGSGVRVSLTDHWYNPFDETIGDFAHITFTVPDKCDWTTVAVEYDTDAKTAKIEIGDKVFEQKIEVDAPHGLSYLHIQTLAEEQDFEGTLVKTLKKVNI